eukprot:1019406-Prymnesium_polylepis.1
MYLVLDGPVVAGRIVQRNTALRAHHGSSGSAGYRKTLALDSGDRYGLNAHASTGTALDRPHGGTCCEYYC